MPLESESNTRVLGVIPARLRSQRLPRKVLRPIAGKPLLAWVYEAAVACPLLDKVMVAVDSEEVESLCRERGWPYLMTASDLPSGTDRLHAVSRAVGAEIYVNIQGDEPLIEPAHIQALLAPFYLPAVDVSTLKVACPAAELADPNTVKVVCARDGRALYFSRASLPFDRDGSHQAKYWKHLGLYAYRRAALERFASLPVGELEAIEKLEQLRLLENGLAIYVSEVQQPTVGVDTEEDLERVAAILQGRMSAVML